MAVPSPTRAAAFIPFLLLLVVLLVTIDTSLARPRAEVIQELEAAKKHPALEFRKWQAKYAINISAVELPRRLKMFKSTVSYCIKFNSENAVTWLGLGPFSHLSATEFKHQAHGYKRKARSTGRRQLAAGGICHSQQYAKVQPVPVAWDWTQQVPAVVSPVQNQGQCNDCWAFASAAALEGLVAITTNTAVVPLSPQAITSCASGSNGCSVSYNNGGGNPGEGFAYIMSNGGLASAATYPFVGYIATQLPLNTNNCSAVLAAQTQAGSSINSYCDVPWKSVSALQSALAFQPVTVGVDAGSSVWQNYQGGIITSSSCGTTVDHAVLAVGYDMTAAEPFWYLKNQWGTGWGENGFVQVSTSVTSSTLGVCGILNSPTIPIM